MRAFRRRGRSIAAAWALFAIVATPAAAQPGAAAPTPGAPSPQESPAAPTGPQQSADVVARAIVRSYYRPTPEVNMVRALRIAYGLNGFFPALRDFAGRQFYRRTHGQPRRRT